MLKCKLLDDMKIDNQTLSQIGNSFLDYYEYRFITREQKIKYIENKLINTISNKNNIIVCLRNKSILLGIVNIIKDDYDSKIFNMGMYKLQNIYLLDSDDINLSIIINGILNKVINELKARNKKSYLLVSLNSNYHNTPLIFNELVKNRFHYINTLLTYTYKKNDVIMSNIDNYPDLVIREVNNSDVDTIVDLARKSFKYSRYHMDPVLNKDSANELLATSARNSILNGFVDIMYVAELNHRVIGYYCAKKRFIPEFGLSFGEAVISAVDEKYRGKGIFKSLNQSILNWFQNNTDFAEMGTYLPNTHVHKTWCNSGQNIVRSTHQLALLIH